MQKVNGSLESGNTEEFLFTYSEEERQQNEINRSNASVVFSPKFIPLYPALLKDGFTITEVLVFGFIDFYTSSASSRFYFTNEQISFMLGVSESSITKAVSKLETEGLIKTNRKIRAGGGQIRFISPDSKNDIVRLVNFTSLTSKKVSTNNNKIKDNKINQNNILERENAVENTTALTLPISNFNSIKTLTEDVLNAISQDYGVPVEFVANIREDLELYCGSTGKRYKDYNLTLRNWVKRDKAKKMYDMASLSKKRGGVYDARD